MTKEVNISKVLKVLFKKSWIIIIAVIILAIVLGMYGHNKNIKGINYGSKAILYIEIEKTDTVDTEKENYGPIFAEMIESDSVLNDVIKQVNKDITIGELRQSIYVSTQSDGGLLKVYVLSKDQTEAVIINKALIAASKGKIKDVKYVDRVEVLTSSTDIGSVKVDKWTDSTDPMNTQDIVSSNSVHGIAYYAAIGGICGLAISILMILIICIIRDKNAFND